MSTGVARHLTTKGYASYLQVFEIGTLPLLFFLTHICRQRFVHFMDKMKIHFSNPHYTVNLRLFYSCINVLYIKGTVYSSNKDVTI